MNCFTQQGVEVGLTDKLVDGGVEEPALLAERFWVRMEGRFQVMQAQHVLGKGDGAEWIHQGAEQVFPGPGFPLARGHLRDRIGQFAGHLPRLWQRLRQWVYQGRVAALIRSLRHLAGTDARREQARQELRGYVTRHAEAISAVDRLRPQVSPAAPCSPTAPAPWRKTSRSWWAAASNAGAGAGLSTAPTPCSRCDSGSIVMAHIGSKP